MLWSLTQPLSREEEDGVAEVGVAVMSSLQALQILGGSARAGFRSSEGSPDFRGSRVVERAEGLVCILPGKDQPA